MNNRITEGTTIDSTTVAVYFQQGLTRRISTALVNIQSIATIQNLALVMAAAEEIESKLDLSVKQATQVEVPATGNPNSNKRGCYGNGRGGGNTNARFASPPTIVVVVRDPSMLAGAMLSGAGVPVEGVVARAGVPPLANHPSLCMTKICTAPPAMPLGTPNGSALLSAAR